MKAGRSIVVAVTILSLAGCAVTTPRPKQLPAFSASPNDASVVDRLPTAAEKLTDTDLPGTYFGVSGAKGSLTVGLLFGALGALGNRAHVQSVNKADSVALGAITSMDLAKVLAREVPSLTIDHVVAGRAFSLVPSANFYFTSHTKFFLTCMITAYSQKSPQWVARYAVAIEGDFDSSSPRSVARAADTVAPCLLRAHALFVSHVSGTLGPFENKTITVHNLDNVGTSSAQWSVAVKSLPDRVVVNDIRGIVQFRRSKIISVE